MVRRPQILWASLAVYAAAILFAPRMHDHGHGDCAGGLCSTGVSAVSLATGDEAEHSSKSSHCCCDHSHASSDDLTDATAARRHIAPGAQASILPPAESAGSADGCLACQFLAMSCAIVQPPQWQGSELLVAPSVSVARPTFVAPIARGFSSRAPPEAAVL